MKWEINNTWTCGKCGKVLPSGISGIADHWSKCGGKALQEALLREHKKGHLTLKRLIEIEKRVMEETEIREAVDKMNSLLNDDVSQEHSFWFESNGFIDAVKFDEVILWDSENDNREYLGEETDTYEPLETCLLREFSTYVKRLNAIIANPEIMNALNHLHRDFRMLGSGAWVPDDHSIQDSLGNIEEIADQLKIELDYEE